MAALGQALILSTYPNPAKSARLLEAAGWLSSAEMTWGTGEPRRLTISNGRESLTVEGETENEVWYRALQQVQKGKPTMTLTTEALPVPLRPDESGGYRVGGSRVPLDVVIREFKNGSTPEEIVSAYSTLDLQTVYAVIAYYLANRKEVDEYLRVRREQAAELRKEIEAKQGSQAGLRAQLLTRKAQREQGHASSGK